VVSQWAAALKWRAALNHFEIPWPQRMARAEGQSPPRHRGSIPLQGPRSLRGTHGLGPDDLEDGIYTERLTLPRNRIPKNSPASERSMLLPPPVTPAVPWQSIPTGPSSQVDPQTGYLVSVWVPHTRTTNQLY
jgi:hypothetical protein